MTSRAVCDRMSWGYPQIYCRRAEALHPSKHYVIMYNISWNCWGAYYVCFTSGLVLLMLAVPLAIGGLFFSERSILSPVSYLAGLATAWGIYEIIGLPCALLFKTSLTTLTVLWSAVMILLTVAGVLVRHTHGRMALLPSKGLQLSRTAKILLALLL